MKKVLSFVLALCLVCTLLPATVLTANAADTEIVFNLGNNKSTTTHADGSSKTTYTETVSGYTLTLSNVSNFYTGANDAKGNGCIKLGASSKTGGFSFTVPADVTGVVIAIAGYKNKAVTVKVNNVSYSVSELSNNGTYKEIEIDTTTNKTVTLITTSTGYRAMVNTITFVIAGSSSSCDHANVTTTVTKDPSCTETGTEAWECDDCGETGTNTLDKVPHSLVDDAGYPATCTEPGLEAGQVCEECGYSTQKEIPAAHNYVNGKCSECGEPEPNEVTGTISFASADHRESQTTSKQVWKNDGIIFTNNKSASTNNVVSNTNPVRLYANSELVFEAPGNILKIVVNCDTASYANALKNSITSGAEVTVNGMVVTIVPNEDATTFTVAKLSAQTRFDSLTVTYEAAAAGCDHAETEVIPGEDATCTEDGWTDGLKCANPDCGEVLEEREPIPATGHTYVNDECSVCHIVCNSYMKVEDVSALEADDKVIITMTTSDGKVYALTNGNGTESAPAATEVTVANGLLYADKGTAADEANLIWNISYSEDGLTIYPNGVTNKWLYCTDTNNGVRVGTNTNKLFNINGTYLQHANSERYVGVYVTETPDWRCYETTGTNVKGQTLAIYKLPDVVYTYDSVSTKYAFLEDAVEVAADIDDGVIMLLDNAAIGELDLENSGAVIDLNGKTLTADVILANVMDSADGNGLIQVGQTDVVLYAAMSNQLVLWDNETGVTGYRVFSYSFVNLGIDADNTDAEQTASAGVLVKSFWCDLVFTNKRAYTLLASEMTTVDIGFVLDWNGNEKTFMYEQDVIVAWAEEEEFSDGSLNFCFYITVTGFEALEEDGTLTVKPILEDAFGNAATVAASEYDYDIA